MDVFLEFCYDDIVNAITTHNIDLLAQFIDGGFNVNYYGPDDNLESLVSIAVYENYIDAVDFLLERGATIKRGATMDDILFDIAEITDPPYYMFEHILNKGLDINKQDEDGNSYLHNFFGSISPYDTPNKKELFKILLKHRINVNLENNSGQKAHYLIPKEFMANYEDEINRLIQSGLTINPDNPREITIGYMVRSYPIPRYQNTSRPKSEMNFAGNKCLQGQYLPVLRYEGLYYGGKKNEDDKDDENDEAFCGTFYYYEPDSQVQLNLGKVLVAAGKFDALWQFMSAIEKQMLLDTIKPFKILRGSSPIKQIFSQIIKYMNENLFGIDLPVEEFFPIFTTLIQNEYNVDKF